MEQDIRWKDHLSLFVGVLVLVLSWSTHTTESLRLQTEWYADYGNLDNLLALGEKPHALFAPPVVADLGKFYNQHNEVAN